MEEKSIDVGGQVVSARRAELVLRFERREVIELWMEGGIFCVERDFLETTKTTGENNWMMRLSNCWIHVEWHLILDFESSLSPAKEGISSDRGV